MPPRTTRPKGRVPQPVEMHPDGEPTQGDSPQYCPIINQRLPDMPALMSSAYGSPVAVLPQSPMRGQPRDLQSVIDRALEAAHAPDEEGDVLVSPRESSRLQAPLPAHMDPRIRCEFGCVRGYCCVVSCFLIHVEPMTDRNRSTRRSSQLLG